ncbi:MAG: 50S ribosomal protein L29 [Acidobacteriota bacterium]|nr:50S ribosomal protein L29 [Acidobacteriota bacterium]
MEAKELREMTQAEIDAVLHDLKEELFTLRFQRAQGSLQDPSRFGLINKDIARLKTVLREKEIGLEEEER